MDLCAHRMRVLPAEASVGRSKIARRPNFHARARMGVRHYRWSHLTVKLREVCVCARACTLRALALAGLLQSYVGPLDRRVGRFGMNTATKDALGVPRDTLRLSTANRFRAKPRRKGEKYV